MPKQTKKHNSAPVLNLPPEEEIEKNYKDALIIVQEKKEINASSLSNILNIGYAQADYVMALLEERGVVGPIEGWEQGKRFRRLVTEQIGIESDLNTTNIVKKEQCANYTFLYSAAVIVPLLSYTVGLVLNYWNFNTEVTPEVGAISWAFFFIFLILVAKLKDKGYIN